VQSLQLWTRFYLMRETREGKNVVSYIKVSLAVPFTIRAITVFMCYSQCPFKHISSTIMYTADQFQLNCRHTTATTALKKCLKPGLIVWSECPQTPLEECKLHSQDSHPPLLSESPPNSKF